MSDGKVKNHDDHDDDKPRKHDKHGEHDADPSGGGIAAPCNLTDLCNWAAAMAVPVGTVQGPYPVPPAESMPTRLPSIHWLQDMWECYAEMYVAVTRLEKRVFCGDQSITNPFLISCPGTGGGNKGGPPPPPQFP